jgi:hypothetical protein
LLAFRCVLACPQAGIEPVNTPRASVVMREIDQCDMEFVLSSGHPKWMNDRVSALAHGYL